jgi:hypothetical protein
MKDLVIGTTIVVVVLVSSVMLFFGGLRLDRFVQPYQEETRRQTYEHSVSREEGTEQQISAYCLNMETQKDPTMKKAFAHYIIDESADYNGPLSSEASRCLQEATDAIRN